MLATPMLVAVLLSVPMLALTASASFQEQGPTPAPSQPLTYPLLCRGGGSLIFDTLRRRDNDAVLEMAMRFSPGSSAAGADGAGLLPQGTCAWIDRPLVAAEPGLIRLNDPLADPVGPSETLSRPDRYWQFMVYNTGLGHSKRWDTARGVELSRRDHRPNSPCHSHTSWNSCPKTCARSPRSSRLCWRSCC